MAERPDGGWLSSPCSSCPGTPCCTVLPVKRLDIQTRSDLLQARSLLSHRRIELGLYDSGAWFVYFRSVCRNLELSSGKCGVHGGPSQPDICRTYSPNRCWYRQAFTVGASPAFLRLNLPRFDFILSRVTYDDEGEIYGVPDWGTMVEGVSAIPLEDEPSIESARDPARESCRPGGCPAGTGETGIPQHDPCRVLSLSVDSPRRPAVFDLLAFRLGFPGVELAIGDDRWTLLLQADCRHLGTARCARAGSPVVVPVREAGAGSSDDSRNTPRPRPFRECDPETSGFVLLSGLRTGHSGDRSR